MKNEFWDKTLNGIDEKFTDSAAEFLSRESDADEGRAREIKPEKKRFRLDVLIGICAAAAAVVAVTAAVKFSKPRGENPIVTPAKKISMDLSDYTADYSLYEKYFEGVWKNTDDKSEKPYFVLNHENVLGSLDGEVLFCEAGGECAMTYTEDGARVLFVRESDGSLSRYDCADALSTENSAVTYEYADEAESGSCVGTVYYKLLCERRDGLAEKLAALELDYDGQHWTRAGTDKAQIRVYSENDSAISLSAQFTNDSGSARYLRVNLQGDEWDFVGVSEYDIFNDDNTLKTFGEQLLEVFDYGIYENAFMGVWENAESGNEMELSYSKTDIYWSSVSSVGYFDGIWVMWGMSGGAGEFLYISEDEPDVMYSAELGGDGTPISKAAKYPYNIYYRKEIIPAEGAVSICTINGVQGLAGFGEYSLVGYEVVNDYLESLEGFAEVFDAAHADFTDAQGVTWSFDDIPCGYAPVGYPNRVLTVLELGAQRIRLGVPFIVKGSYDQSIFDTDEGLTEFLEKGLEISQFELTFEKTEDGWQHTATELLEQAEE